MWNERVQRSRIINISVHSSRRTSRQKKMVINGTFFLVKKTVYKRWHYHLDITILFCGTTCNIPVSNVYITSFPRCKSKIRLRGQIKPSRDTKLVHWTTSFTTFYYRFKAYWLHFAERKMTPYLFSVFDLKKQATQGKVTNQQGLWTK